MSRARRLCSKADCSEPVVGRKLCSKHYQQAWKAGAFINAGPATPRKRDRKICPTDHKHASASTCYIQHQCRCDACMDHHNAMESSRRKLKAYGRFDTGLVDAEPVREHMMLLADFGLGYKRVASIAGLGITPVRNVIWGRQEPGRRYGEMQKRIKRETAERILAVKPDISILAAGALMPSRGFQRRVQALVSRGWSQSKLCLLLEVDRRNFWRMMQVDVITVGSHRRFAAIYDELWDQLPPRDGHRDKIAYARSLSFAKQRRWLPPLAWDDIDNDVEPPVQDESETDVDEMAIELAMQGEMVRLSGLERRAAITRLAGVKLSDGVIAERLHLADRTVWRIRQELGIAAPLGADGQPVVA